MTDRLNSYHDRCLSALAVALIVAAGAAGPAVAQADTLDTDGDGFVSYTEILMSLPDLTEAEFQALDADGDGALNEEELNAAVEGGLIELG